MKKNKFNNFNEIKKRLKKSPKKWLITGVAGFIGSNLLETLLILDQSVIGIDNFSTGFKKNLLQVKNLVSRKQWKKFKFIKGNICNYKLCEINCKGVDYVLHQAALGSVPRSIKDPIRTNRNNIDGFLNIIFAAKNSKVSKFVYASSSSVYGDNNKLPKIEKHIGNPLSPYATTKNVNEMYAEVFYKIYNFQSIGLRYFNVFGKRQDPNGSYAAVIPKWISALINNKKIFINGDGKTSRDFCFIDNVVQANILAATSKKEISINQTYNVALGERITLTNLYNEIKKQLEKYNYDFKNSKLIYRDFRPGDVRHSLADIKKSIKLLGYSPTHKLSEGLKKTIKWYNDIN